jgi:hypothetical protein
MAVSSFAHWETASLLQAAHSDYQIGAFENFHQPVEDTLIVLRPGPQVVFQYELRFVNRLKCQLLISHLFLPIKQMPRGKKEEWEIKPLLGNIPAFLSQLINFYFNGEPCSAGSRRLPGSTRHVVKVGWGTFETCLGALRMSVLRGGPEVIGLRPNRCDW